MLAFYKIFGEKQTNRLVFIFNILAIPIRLILLRSKTEYEHKNAPWVVRDDFSKRGMFRTYD